MSQHEILHSVRRRSGTAIYDISMEHVVYEQVCIKIAGIGHKNTHFGAVTMVGLEPSHDDLKKSTSIFTARAAYVVIPSVAFGTLYGQVVMGTVSPRLNFHIA